MTISDGALERRAIGAEQLVMADITELAAHLIAGDRYGVSVGEDTMSASRGAARNCVKTKK